MADLIKIYKVLQIDGHVPFSGIDGADPSFGPLYLSELAHWENDRMASLLMIEWKQEIALPPFIKIRSEDRKWLDFFSKNEHPLWFPLNKNSTKVKPFRDNRCMKC